MDAPTYVRRTQNWHQSVNLNWRSAEIHISHQWQGHQEECTDFVCNTFKYEKKLLEGEGFAQHLGIMCTKHYNMVPDVANNYHVIVCWWQINNRREYGSWLLDVYIS